MTIIGLENDYYLAENDIWITVEFDDEPVKLELLAESVVPALALPVFRFYPDGNWEVRFNISQIVRAMLRDPMHLSAFNIQQFRFTFNGYFVDPLMPNEQQVVLKYFVRGGAEREGLKVWHLQENQPMWIGDPIRWIGASETFLMFGNYKVGASVNLVDLNVPIDIPTEDPDTVPMIPVRIECDYKILKYRNSLGGYEYFLFDRFEENQKSEKGRTIPIPATALAFNNVKNLEAKYTRTIKFFSRTPAEAQNHFSELAKSREVYLYTGTTPMSQASWEPLVLAGSSSLENNWDKVYHNEIEFEFPNYITNRA